MRRITYLCMISFFAFIISNAGCSGDGFPFTDVYTPTEDLVPDIEITYPSENGARVNGPSTIFVRGTADDAGAVVSVEISFDDNNESTVDEYTPVTGTEEWLYQLTLSDGLANGEYTISVRATDDAAQTNVRTRTFRYVNVNSPGESDFVFVSSSNTSGTEDGTKASPFSTIQAGIDAAETAGKAGKDVAVTPGSGTYNEDVVMKNGISVYGGYSADFSTRDIPGGTPVNITSIKSISTGGNELEPVYTVQFDDVTAVIDGFTIQGADTVDSAAVNCITGSMATVSNNTITGGACTGRSYAVRVYDESKAIVMSNTITGGSGALSYGVYTLRSDPRIISNTSIGGGTGTENYGIYAAKQYPYIASNTLITGGSAGTKTRGIFCDLECRGTITANTQILAGAGTDRAVGIEVAGISDMTITDNPDIQGGTGSVFSCGIYCADESDCIITGNRNTENGTGINGGTGSGTDNASYGIYIHKNSNPTVSNNIINAGTSTNDSFAIYLSDNSAPVIDANTILATGGTNRCGIYVRIKNENGLDIEDSQPQSVTNNLFDSSLLAGAGVKAFYRDGERVDVTAITIGTTVNITGDTLHDATPEDTPNIIAESLIVKSNGIKAGGDNGAGVISGVRISVNGTINYRTGTYSNFTLTSATNPVTADFAYASHILYDTADEVNALSGCSGNTGN